jgi:hypothetical protein
METKHLFFMLLTNLRAYCSVESLQRWNDPKIVRIVNDSAKSAADPKAYRRLQFENGLEVLLISNPSFTMSAARLHIKIGRIEP